MSCVTMNNARMAWSGNADHAQIRSNTGTSFSHVLLLVLLVFLLLLLLIIIVLFISLILFIFLILLVLLIIFRYKFPLLPFFSPLLFTPVLNPSLFLLIHFLSSHLVLATGQHFCKFKKKCLSPINNMKILWINCLHPELYY